MIPSTDKDLDEQRAQRSIKALVRRDLQLPAVARLNGATNSGTRLLALRSISGTSLVPLTITQRVTSVWPPLVTGSHLHRTSTPHIDSSSHFTFGKCLV
jgi:hypothetical protein